MKEVSKEEFLKVYNEHAPNLFLQIMFKYFSTDMKRSLGTKIIVALFLIFNVLAIIVDARKGETSTRNLLLAIANIPFAIWGLSAFVAFNWNKLRTRKIQKILGLTLDEYNFYATLYVTN